MTILSRVYGKTCFYKLTCPSSSADRGLSSRLELSYNYIEDEEAKHLFLLCCLLEEDKAISFEDLARYAFGLSLFDKVYETIKVKALGFCCS